MHGLLKFGICWTQAWLVSFENGHAQVACRAKALRTPDPYYDRKKFHFKDFYCEKERSLVVT